MILADRKNSKTITRVHVFVCVCRDGGGKRGWVDGGDLGWAGKG